MACLLIESLRKLHDNVKRVRQSTFKLSDLFWALKALYNLWAASYVSQSVLLFKGGVVSAWNILLLHIRLKRDLVKRLDVFGEISSVLGVDTGLL